MGFGVPLVLESPKGRNFMEYGFHLGLLQIVVEPAAVTAFAVAVVVIGTLTPRTGVDHLVCIGITDVLVKDLRG